MMYINQSSSDAGGWASSEIRQFVNEELFKVFPSELQSAIKIVDKVSDGGFKNPVLVTTKDNCWLASCDEVGLPPVNDVLHGQGETYSLVFSSSNATRSKYVVDTTQKGGWWLRSSHVGNSNDTNTLWDQVMTGGGRYGYFPHVELYVAFGFCI